MKSLPLNAESEQNDDDGDYDEQNPIPMVLIVVQGGPNTLLTGKNKN
jgi:hypothetical protein